MELANNITLYIDEHYGMYSITQLLYLILFGKLFAEIRLVNIIKKICMLANLLPHLDLLCGKARFRTPAVRGSHHSSIRLHTLFHRFEQNIRIFWLKFVLVQLSKILIRMVILKNTRIL